MAKLKSQIMAPPKLEYPRSIVFDGVQYLFYSLESAELVWLEYLADAKGPEDYQKRIDELYQTALDAGIKEFDFWVKKVGWDTLIKGAAGMLNQFKRWNRK